MSLCLCPPHLTGLGSLNLSLVSSCYPSLIYYVLVPSLLLGLKASELKSEALQLPTLVPRGKEDFVGQLRASAGTAPCLF